MLGLDLGFHTAEARRLVAQALWDAHAAHDRRPLIVIDEAASPMALCLVGQPELRSRLRLRAFEAISQRVTLRFHLVGLPEAETKAYIGHHLKVAGVAHPLFSDEAVHLVHQFTKGIPRRINNVATGCLLAGFVEQKMSVILEKGAA